MDKSTYSLVAGIALLLTAVTFFVLPAIIDRLDAFVPVMLSIVSLVASLSFFGFSSRSAWRSSTTRRGTIIGSVRAASTTAAPVVSPP